MKSKFTQRPQKQGWADKKAFADARCAVGHEQEIRA